jgi:hypothetical protein
VIQMIGGCPKRHHLGQYRADGADAPVPGRAGERRFYRGRSATRGFRFINGNLPRSAGYLILGASLDPLRWGEQGFAHPEDCPAVSARVRICAPFAGFRECEEFESRMRKMEVRTSLYAG